MAHNEEGREGEVHPYVAIYGRYVKLQRVEFLSRFGLKTGIDFARIFWSGTGYGFRGNYGSATMNVFIVSIPNE